jgi:ethanolamine ammonia-lyase small subunit
MTEALKKSLRHYTTARVALDRAGSGLATREVLDFQLAHAQARDAVHAVLDVGSLFHGLKERGMQAIALRSGAGDRWTYLRHPGLGRVLNLESAAKLTPSPCQVVFVIADGLSASAVARHALPLLDETRVLLPRDWSVGPVCIVEQGRVAIGDVVGEALQAKTSVVLIGERPGLSSPDSLGAYITWNPRSGRKDAERNCVSNIRPEGLGYATAARMISFYLHEAAKRELSGVGLKLTMSLPTE